MPTSAVPEPTSARARRLTLAVGGRRGGSASSEPGARAEGEAERSRYAAF